MTEIVLRCQILGHKMHNSQADVVTIRQFCLNI